MNVSEYGLINERKERIAVNDVGGLMCITHTLCSKYYIQTNRTGSYGLNKTIVNNYNNCADCVYLRINKKQEKDRKYQFFFSRIHGERLMYSVSQKSPLGLLIFSPDGWEFLINFYIPIIC